MSFVSDSQVKDSVAAGLHKDADDLSDSWTEVITDANTAAYDDIVGHFLELGYSKAQIDSWDRGPTFQRFLARYQALIDGAGDKDEVGEWRTELDYWRRKLEAITTLEVADELEDPLSNETGTVGRGDLSNSSDIFSLDTEW